jgi:hypothetical protein
MAQTCAFTASLRRATILKSEKRYIQRRKRQDGKQNILVVKADAACSYKIYYSVLKTASDAGYMIAIQE